MLPRLTARDTIKEIKQAAPKRPANAGEYWTGINFGDLLDDVRDRADVAGWEPAGWVGHLWRGGMDLVASLDLPGYPLSHIGITPSIGIAVSNARRRSTALYAGVSIPQCSSSVVMRTMEPLHRHTIRMDLDAVLKQMMNEAAAGLSEFDDEIATLKKRRLSQERAASILAAAGRANVTPWSRIGRVDDVWNRGGDRSVWGLLVAFGSVSDLNTPVKHMDRLAGFYKMVTGKTPARIY